jgi:hypothetical protein
MADTLAAIQTWACPNCMYKQYHDPTNEQEMNAIFSEPRYWGRPVGACPACWAGENDQRTKGEFYLESINGTDLSSLGQRRVADDATLEAMTKPDLDANGQQIMEQVGEHYEMHIDQSTGGVGSVLVPDYAPKMRPLTDDELAELKAQRDQNLDALENVAVAEVSQEADPEAV